MHLGAIFTIVLSSRLFVDSDAVTINEHQSYTISCSNKVIDITYAFYGKSWWCDASGEEGVLDGRCYGKTSCTVTATNSWFGDPCRGTFKELRFEWKCFETAAWTSWQAWSSYCPSSCQGTTITRYRTCSGIGSCSGSSSQSANCLTVGCPRHGVWGGWSSWSSHCPSDCLGSTITRYRSCNNPSPYNGGNYCSGSSSSSANCLNVGCPRNGGWSSWDSWSLYCPSDCYSQTITRYRYCTNPSPANGGAYCSGSNSAAANCLNVGCPRHGQWATWTLWADSCPSSCLSTTISRTRTCTNPSPHNGGNYCSGSDTSYEDCLVVGCPRHGEWATWLEWNSCTVTCGTGNQIRHRTCTDPSPYNGGNDCVGSDNSQQACGGGDCFYCGTRYIGYGDPELYTSTVDSTTGSGYLIEDGAFTVTCCGVISKWEFYAKKSGEIRFQVWRKSGTSTYTLLGENSYYVPSGAEDKLHVINIPQSERITVLHKDYIGWYTPGIEIVSYSSRSTYPNNARRDVTGSISEGETYNWQNVAVLNGRAYALRALTTDNIGPFFESIDQASGQTTHIFDNTAIGTNFYEIKIYDLDPRDNKVVAMTSASSNFEYSNSFISTSQQLSTGQESLSLKVNDSCQNTDLGYISVKVTNTPPLIKSLPDSILVHEDTIDETLLHTLVTSDQQNDHVMCSVQTTSPRDAPFSVKSVPGSNSYGIFLNQNPGLDFMSEKTFRLTIQCEDSHDYDINYFYCYVKKNQPPSFSNLPASLTLEASTVRAGDVIYAISVADPESDPLTFSMTSSPSNAPFSVLNSGVVQVTRDLATERVAGYDLIVTVEDTRTSIPPKVLSVYIKAVNNPPVISSLPIPHTLSVLENTPLSTPLYELAYMDLDANDSHVIGVVYGPSSGSSYFDISNSGVLSLAYNNLDYEEIPSRTFTVTFSVSDAKETATASLTVSVIDDNEVCSFHQTQYLVFSDEGGGGSTLSDPGFVLNDEDSGDSHTYRLDCGDQTWRFSQDTNTGSLSFAYPYDLDSIGISFHKCTVTAVDTGGLSCSTSVIIKISDVNDNTPSFYLTQETYYVSPNVRVGTVLGNIPADDPDVSAFGSVIFWLDLTRYTKYYIGINETGTVYVRDSLAGFSTGDKLDLDLMVVDSGGLSSTVLVTILFYEPNITVASTTEEAETFMTSSWNTPWVVGSAVMCAVFAGASLLFIYKYAAASTEAVPDLLSAKRRKSKSLQRKKERDQGKKTKKEKKPNESSNEEAAKTNSTSGADGDSQGANRDSQGADKDGQVNSTDIAPRGSFPTNNISRNIPQTDLWA